MKKLVEFSSDDGAILIEVEAQADVVSEHGALEGQRGVMPVARGPAEVLTKAQHSFEQALEKVNPIAVGLKSKLGTLRDPPDEIEVEFGLNMSIEAGAVVAKGGAGANFKVKLKWSKK